MVLKAKRSYHKNQKARIYVAKRPIDIFRRPIQPEALKGSRMMKAVLSRTDTEAEVLQQSFFFFFFLMTKPPRFLFSNNDEGSLLIRTKLVQMQLSHVFDVIGQFGSSKCIFPRY